MRARPSAYVRKVWYHEQAARFCEYVALSLVKELRNYLVGTPSQFVCDCAN